MSLARRVLAGEPMNATRKAVLDRIELLEQALFRAREYLESGKHAHWTGFRPLFDRKLRDGKELPPHKDWVKRVFIPRMERALSQAEKVLERISQKRVRQQRGRGLTNG